MNSKPLHIVFAGGGTAGHLFPGLATASELAEFPRRPRITFAGTGKPFEVQQVIESGFEYRPFSSAPAPSGPKSLLSFLQKNLAGYYAARRFLRGQGVSVVVGLGSYASLPMARAAAALGIPLVLLEQNAYPGKANRWLAPRANLVCTAFEAARAHLQCTGPVRFTGNPLRAGFRPRRNDRGPEEAWQHRLLVLGGSGGAQSLNEHVPRALGKLRKYLEGWQVVHQAGAANAQSTAAAYRAANIEATVIAFVHNMPQVLRSSDLAVCRAGGGALAETAATGVPALLIPYPQATDDHQRHNAAAFVAAGAARMIDEHTVGGRLDDALTVALADLLTGAERRRDMARAMLALARPDAAWQVAKMVYELATRAAADKVA